MATAKGAGRTRDVKQYDLYRVEGSKEIYIGRFVRDMIRDTYGINTKSLKQDIKEKRLMEGNSGKYRIYNAGQLKLAGRLSGSMPEHVETVKESSGCRFGG